MRADRPFFLPLAIKVVAALLSAVLFISAFIAWLAEIFGSLKIPTKLSELTDDETHRTVTDSEKENWNAPTMVAQNDAPQNIDALWIDLDDNSDDGNLIDETLT